MKNKTKGYCRICGYFKELTFEHIPPRKAFNDNRVMQQAFEKLLAAEDSSSVKGRYVQKGVGFETLCAQCNNFTGRFYGPAYISFAHQAMSHVLSARQSNYNFPCKFLIKPQPVLKQVLSFFFSINPPAFRQRNLGLVKYLLNEDSNCFPATHEVWAFLTLTPRFRAVGLGNCASLNLGAGSRVQMLGEIAFPPLGFVLTKAGDTPPLETLVNITHFSKYSRKDEREIVLPLPMLSTDSIFWCDYRSAHQIRTDAKEAGLACSL